MILDWGTLTPELFLKEYWQKKPLLIKNAFNDFKDPITADELAGLAMEEELESRIISFTEHRDDKKWQVDLGPFEAFERYGESQWTLLVQAVNNWSKPTSELMTPFQFIPNWRLDDVMVSFSTPHGGVGPHLDQYDVFIIQGEGKRHWQVGLPDSNFQELIPHPDLKQTSAFEPIIDVITEPGDLLYIPPNHPHNGYALENSLNYSIGFQAPNNQELWSAFADKLLDEDIGTSRIGDKNRATTSSPELLTDKDVQNLKTHMLAQLNNDSLFQDFIGKYLTQNHHTMEILIPVTPITDKQLNDIFAYDEIILTPVLGIKSLISQSPKLVLSMNGDNFELQPETVSLATALTTKTPLTAKEVKSFIVCLKNRQLLTSILNKGYWYIE